MPSAAKLNSSSAIGIFDSGVGGLTVLKAVQAKLPEEQLLYLGDTARLPYGTKTPASVQRYALRAADYLVARDIKLLVVACNTASAIAIPKLKERLGPMPVIGVVEPGAARAVALSQAQQHLVLATEATTRQLAYTQAILELAPNANVQEIACSMFVALAEEGWGQDDIAYAVADKYLASFRQGNHAHGVLPDTAILGCTHFPLVRDAISQALGDEIQIVDSAQTTAERVAKELQQQNLIAQAGSQGRFELLATEGPGRFARVGGNFLGEDLSPDDVEVVDIQGGNS